jgi:hypothetical protein
MIGYSWTKYLLQTKYDARLDQLYLLSIMTQAQLFVVLSFPDLLLFYVISEMKE